MSEKKEPWRPSKIHAFTEVFKEVVNDDDNAIDLTEEELVLLTNEKLEDKDKINYSTFRNYKKQRGKEIDFSNFLAVYKKAFLKQKKGLLRKLKNEDGSWQRIAWLLERKEKALNKTIIDYNETKGKNEKPDQTIVVNKYYSKDEY